MQNQENLDVELSDLEQDIQESILDQEDEPKKVQPQAKHLEPGLTIRQKQTNEILYIIFTHYRKHIQEIAARYNCIIKISMNSYMIANTNSQNKQQFEKCCKDIFSFVKSINYDQIGDFGKSSGHFGDKIRYIYSPYFTKMLQSKGINLIVFNHNIYAFSRKLAKEVIKKEILAVTKDKCIFPVRYNKLSENKLSKLSFQEYYREINYYLQKVITFYQDFLSEREVIAQINTSKTFVYLIGERQKFLMEAKLTMKNVVQSMVCLIIKSKDINENKLIKFLNAASTYPIHYGRLSEKRFIIVSKDNILKQLITKSAKFFEYLGIEEGKDKSEANVGLFLIRSPTFKTKIEQTRDVCKLKGYDLFENGNVYYINQVFYNEGIEEKNIIKNLLGTIMLVLQENKQKFETMGKMKKDQRESKNQPKNNLKYTLKGGRVQQQNLSKVMKRDVLTEKLQMKKQFMIAYNIIEGKEQMKYWTINANGEQGSQVKQSQLKVGKYLRGYKKVGQDQTVAIIFQEIISII